MLSSKHRFWTIFFFQYAFNINNWLVRFEQNTKKYAHTQCEHIDWEVGTSNVYWEVGTSKMWSLYAQWSWKSNNNNTENDYNNDGQDADWAHKKKVRLLPNTRKDWQVLLYCQSENSSIRKKISYASKWLTLNNWKPFFMCLVRISHIVCVCVCVCVVYSDMCVIHF